MSASNINPETLSQIGRWSERQRSPHRVEASEVRRFAQAVMDDSPRTWRDESVPGRAFDGPVAPPAFAVHAFRRAPGTADPLERLAREPSFDGVGLDLRDNLPALGIRLPRLLNGGYEHEIYGYFRVGDYIFRRSRYAELFEKQSKSGPMIFVILEDEYSREDGDVYLLSRNTLIYR